MTAHIDGIADGYGIGLAGGHAKPLFSMKDAHRWLQVHPTVVRRRFARGFAIGALKRLSIPRNRSRHHVPQTSDE